MSCQRCKSERVLSGGAKSSDLNHFSIGEHEHDGYVPEDLGIGGGDYLEIELCLDCGQMQGDFPLPPAEMEKDVDVGEISEDD